MTIEQVKKDFIATLDSIDKNKLSLPDLKLYAETLKTVSEIQTKSYAEAVASAMSVGFNSGFKPQTVSELK